MSLQSVGSTHRGWSRLGDHDRDPRPRAHAAAAARLPQHPPPRRPGRGLRASRPPAPLAPGRGRRRRRGGAALALVPAHGRPVRPVARRQPDPAIHAHVVDWQASTWDDGPRVSADTTHAAIVARRASPAGLTLLDPSSRGHPRPTRLPGPGGRAPSAPPCALRALHLPVPALGLLSRPSPHFSSAARLRHPYSTTTHTRKPCAWSGPCRSRRQALAWHDLRQMAAKPALPYEVAVSRSNGIRRIAPGSVLAARPIPDRDRGRGGATDGRGNRESKDVEAGPGVGGHRDWSRRWCWPTCCTTRCFMAVRSRRRRGSDRGRRRLSPAGGRHCRHGGHAARGEVEDRGHHDRRRRKWRSSAGRGRRHGPDRGEHRPPGRDPAAGQRRSSARSMPLLGQKVKKGDVLVVLDSPDVGTARLNLHNRQRELVTVRTEAAWKNEIAANVARLIPELRADDTRGARADRRGPRDARRQEAPRRARSRGGREEVRGAREEVRRPAPRGQPGDLLEAYANFEIAHHEAEKTSGLYRQKHRRRASGVPRQAHRRGGAGQVRGGARSRSSSTPTSRS